MAKSKHSAALFEVITRSRPLDRQHRGGFFHRMAGWFRSGRNPDAPAPVYRSAMEGELAPAPEIVAPESSPPFEADPAPTAAAPPASYAPVQTFGDSGRRGIAVDSARREIALRISYISAFTAGCALLTALALAFLIGQRVGAGRRAAAAATVPQIAPADNDVFDVRSSRLGSVDAGRSASGDQATSPATQPVRSRERVAGRNYIIVQSYPEMKTANEIAKLLTDHGIECTVERIAGWRWPCVVTVDGYTTLSGNSEYVAQIKKIRELSDTFAKRGTFKALDPTPKKWTAPPSGNPIPAPTLRPRGGR